MEREEEDDDSGDDDWRRNAREEGTTTTTTTTTTRVDIATRETVAGRRREYGPFVACPIGQNDVVVASDLLMARCASVAPRGAAGCGAGGGGGTQTRPPS